MLLIFLVNMLGLFLWKIKRKFEKKYYFSGFTLKKMMSSKQNLFLSLKHDNFTKITTWKNKECFLIMISSYLELMLIIATYLSCKLILFRIKCILLHRKKASPRLVWSSSEDTKVSFMVAPGERYKPENNGIKWYGAELHKFWGWNGFK